MTVGCGCKVSAIVLALKLPRRRRHYSTLGVPMTSGGTLLCCICMLRCIGGGSRFWASRGGGLVDDGCALTPAVGDGEGGMLAEPPALGLFPLIPNLFFQFFDMCLPLLDGPPPFGDHAHRRRGSMQRRLPV